MHIYVQKYLYTYEFVYKYMQYMHVVDTQCVEIGSHEHILYICICTL